MANSDSQTEESLSKQLSTSQSNESSTSSPSVPSTEIKRGDERLGFIFLSVGRMPTTIFLLTFFVPYLALLAKHSVNEHGSVSILFASLKPSSAPTAAIMIASALSTIFCPMLGALADFSPYRRALLKVFAMCCGIMFCLVTVVVRQTWWLGFLLLIVMFFAGHAADFLANSYLAEVADSPGERSKVSSAALGFGLLAQVSLLIMGMMVSYYFAPLPLRPNGTQFEQANAKGFATIRTMTSKTFNETVDSMTNRESIEDRWDDVDGGSRVKRTIKTKFLVASSSRLWVSAPLHRPFTSDSDAPIEHVDESHPMLEINHFVAFSESNRGQQLHGRKIVVNAIVRPDGESCLAQVHLVSFDKDGKIIKPLTKKPLKQLLGPNIDYKLHVEERLPENAYYLYYVIQVHSGSAFIMRLDAMDEVLYITPILCLISGVWLLIWSAAGLRRLGERIPRHSHNRPLPRLLLKSVLGPGKTLKRTASDSVLAKSLLAVAFYSASVGSTMLMGPIFVTEKLEISQFLMGLAMLATIFASIVGAGLFVLLGNKVGYNRALALAYLVWFLDMVLMFFLLRERDQAKWLFLTVPLMGIASGGSLALARAVFASQIPPGLECELFGLFNFSQSFMGPLALCLFMAANELLGDLQWGIASQSVFMLLAFALQVSIREEDIASRRARQMVSVVVK